MQDSVPSLRMSFPNMIFPQIWAEWYLQVSASCCRDLADCWWYLYINSMYWCSWLPGKIYFHQYHNSKNVYKIAMYSLPSHQSIIHSNRAGSEKPALEFHPSEQPKQIVTFCKHIQNKAQEWYIGFLLRTWSEMLVFNFMSFFQVKF